MLHYEAIGGFSDLNEALRHATRAADLCKEGRHAKRLSKGVFENSASTSEIVQQFHRRPFGRCITNACLR